MGKPGGPSFIPTSTKPGMAKLEREILTLSSHIDAATYRLLVLIREFDEHEAWGGAGILSCAHWLSWRCGFGVVAAREKVRVAHALKALPRISEAFRQGAVSYSKVRAMTRVATAENESLLLMYAEHATGAQLETLVRQYRGQQARDRANAQQTTRAVRYYWDEDGSLVLKARLPAEEGARVLKALELGVEALERAGAGESGDTVDSPATPYSGDTAESSEAGWKPVEVTGRVYPQWGRHVSEASAWGRHESAWCRFSARRADALVLMADTLLARGPAARPLPERYLVTVHVGAQTLSSAGAPGRCELEDGPALAPETVRRLACDASLVELREDSEGRPLDVGRKARTVPPALQRALRTRDASCRFPGCTHRHWLEAHHVKHWADGGETKLANLARLCRFHHKLVHERGFTVEVLDDGALRFLDPQGRPIDPRPPVHRRERGEDLAALNSAEGLDIDHSTGQCLWEGYAPDYCTAVEALQRLDGKLPEVCGRHT